MKVHDRLQLYPLVRVVVALIAGVVAGHSLRAAVPTEAWLGATGAALIASFACRGRKMMQSLFILATATGFGALIFSMATDRARVKIPTGEQLSEAVIIDVPQLRGKTLQCDLFVLRGSMSGRKVKAAILRDTLEGRYRRLTVGSGLAIRSTFRPLADFYSDTHFNYKQWLEGHGFCARTLVYHRNWHTLQLDLRQMPRMERLKLLARKVRSRLLEHYAANGLDEQNYAIVAAMTLGDKSMLSKETKNVYAATGVSHVLALSGLHLSIIFGLLTVIFRGRSSRRMQLLVMTVVAVWMYVFLTGMSASVMRSAIMLTVYSFTALLNRGKMSLNTLALTAIVMLMMNPLSLWDISFQLSFMAVLSILLLYGPIYRLIPGRWLQSRGIVDKLWGMVAVSVAAQIGTAPLVAYYFGRFSCYFLLTNFIAVPMTAVILYTSCILFVLMPSPTIQGWIGMALAWMVGRLNACLSAIALWPGASVDGIRMNGWQLLMVYISMGCLVGILYYLHKAYQIRRSLSQPNTRQPSVRVLK